MAKKKKKGKKKGRKKKKKQIVEEGPKKPSEKSLLKVRVEELKKELETAHRELGRQEAGLQSLKERHAEEIVSKECCVDYLQRLLMARTAGVVEEQQRLQRVEEAMEMSERRADRMLKSVEGRREVVRSLFQQEKTDGEEKLSRLEDQRLQRSSQVARVKRLEEALEEKNTILQQDTRRADAVRASNLLLRRREFEDLMDGFASHSAQVFVLSLPVRARREMRENMRTRDRCSAAADHLLVAQDRNRLFKQRQGTLNVELETQKLAEVAAEVLENGQEHRLEELEENAAALLSEISALANDVAEVHSGKAEAEEVLPSEGFNFQRETATDSPRMEKSSSEESADSSPPTSHSQRSTSPSEGTSKQELLHFMQSELKGVLDSIARLRDEWLGVLEILEDQQTYGQLLDDRLRETSNRNGLRASVVLRTGKLLRARQTEVQGLSVDVNLLHQIRALLQDADRMQFQVD